MATYTADQLSGAGVPTEALTSGVTYTFTFTSPSTLGSTYFTFESVRNENGFYASSTPTAEGTLANLTSVQSPITSPYIFSVVINQGGGSFEFTPSNNVAAGAAFLRGTGDTTLEIS